jgi:hypothetical protein
MRILLVSLICLLPPLAFAQTPKAPASLASTAISMDIHVGSPFDMKSTTLLEPDGTFYQVANTSSFYLQVTQSPLLSGTYAYQPNADNTATITFNYSNGSRDVYGMSFEYSSYTNSNLRQCGSFPSLPYTSSFWIEPLSAAWNFVNVSSRSLVSAAVPSITGFVIGGDIPRYVLVRAIGPSLLGLGVTDAVPSASVAVYQGSTLVGQNSGWSVPASNVASLTATFAQVGAFTLSPGSGDAAMVVLLSPGSYTVQGWATQTGEVLVEAYLVP